MMLTMTIGAALCFSIWQQSQLNVFNLVAAILVLALALDYAVFFTSALRKAEVMQAVILSAATSCLAFGMLSFSQTPAVASFGFTVFSGVALAALMAPLLPLLSCKESVSGGTL
jgi:predicted exporter